MTCEFFATHLLFKIVKFFRYRCGDNLLSKKKEPNTTKLSGTANVLAFIRNDRRKIHDTKLTKKKNVNVPYYALSTFFSCEILHRFINSKQTYEPNILSFILLTFLQVAETNKKFVLKTYCVHLFRADC